jgi:hypothetical protein
MSGGPALQFGRMSRTTPSSAFGGGESFHDERLRALAQAAAAVFPRPYAESLVS